jgi:hypothetical protein
VDGTREILPLVLLFREAALTFSRELVDAPVAPIDLGPPTRQQPAALEPVKRRIESAFRQIECAVTADAQGFRNGVAVGGVILKGGEEKQIEVTLEDFRLHTSACYT